MSGGSFDYSQYHIREIADRIDDLIRKNGKEKTKEEIESLGYYGIDWFDRYPEDKFYYKYSDEVIERFKEAVNVLRIAEVYAQRVDWLISSDDSEESFLERLIEDLNKLKNNGIQ